MAELASNLSRVTFVLLALAIVAIIAIAFVAVGHAVGTTEAMPPQIVVDVEESIEFCAQALPDDVTAQLSYDELRRTLRLHFEWIQAFHWTPDTGGSGPVLFEQFDPLDYVMERAEITGLAITTQQAAAVIEAHSDYLMVMGALHIDDQVDVEADLKELPLLDEFPDEQLTTGDDVAHQPGHDAEDDPDRDRT